MLEFRHFKTTAFFALSICLISCEKIETGDTLAPETIEHIKSLGLLDQDEKIIYFYSNYKKSRAGSFFTAKRVAHYWLDDSAAKTDTSFLFYKDIARIDTVYNVPDFDSPYMEITSTAGAKFRVYVEGSTQQKRMFFEEALSLWLRNRNHSFH